MKFLICAVVCLIALTGLLAYHETAPQPDETAACGQGLFGIRGRIQSRRAAGEGVFQSNGPLRRGRLGLRGC